MVIVWGYFNCQSCVFSLFDFFFNLLIYHKEGPFQMLKIWNSRHSFDQQSSRTETCWFSTRINFVSDKYNLARIDSVILVESKTLCFDIHGRITRSDKIIKSVFESHGLHSYHSWAAALCFSSIKSWIAYEPRMRWHTHTNNSNFSSASSSKNSHVSNFSTSLYGLKS